MTVKYAFAAIVLALAVLLIPATCQLPSDLITKKPAPAVLDLRNTDPSSARVIDSLNPELQAFKSTETAPLGHYNAATLPVIQAANETVVPAIKAFLEGNASQGKGDIEPMNLTEYNNTMVWF